MSFKEKDCGDHIHDAICIEPIRSDFARFLAALRKCHNSSTARGLAERTRAFDRGITITLPYFGAASRCIPGTKLILTAPQRFARVEAENRKIKVLKAPGELTGFKYLMIWHPRVNTDAAHAWLRSEIRRIGQTISA